MRNQSSPYRRIRRNSRPDNSLKSSSALHLLQRLLRRHALSRPPLYPPILSGTVSFLIFIFSSDSKSDSPESPGAAFSPPLSLSIFSASEIFLSISPISGSSSRAFRQLARASRSFPRFHENISVMVEEFRGLISLLFHCLHRHLLIPLRLLIFSPTDAESMRMYRDLWRCRRSLRYGLGTEFPGLDEVTSINTQEISVIVLARMFESSNAIAFS